MARDQAIARYRRLYAGLLRLYPAPFRQRFGEGMTQTFNDLCRELREAESGLSAFLLYTFAETSTGIIRERMTMIKHGSNLVRIALVTTFLLLIPLIAMRFTPEVAWDLADFVVAGALLFGAGLTYELVAGKAGNTAYRIAVGLAVATALILVWMNLAVGLIGSEHNPANLMYLGVLVVGVIGAIVARFRPRGMARALFATALAQALVPVIALFIWRSRVPSGGALERVLALNAFFVLPFVVAAVLFRIGAKDAERA